ncbi:hypothetical protein ACLB2K_065763 [Fragaria x ananassa]
MAQGLQTQASSSGQGSHNKAWQWIWRANVLPKVKNFVWGLKWNSLPTRDALHKRVELVDRSCLFCCGERETAMHVFKDCGVVACMWLCSPLGLHARNHRSMSVEEWVNSMVCSLPKQQVEVFIDHVVGHLE